MKRFFNEHDAYAAEWLRNLYPEATVDTRSIKDVESRDVAGMERVHFFGGIGGWDEALRLAGWSGPVWTGSCPCQPYSSAGKGEGDADARNLWPEMFRLIRECRPAVVFGEQVDAAIRHGWLDGVFADLEAEGYACGAIVVGAHSAGAPHIRQRIFWVGDRRKREQIFPARRPGPEFVRLAEPVSARIRDCGSRTDDASPRGTEGDRKERQRVRFDFGDARPLDPAIAAIIAEHGYWPGPCPDCGAKPGEFHGGHCPGPHRLANGDGSRHERSGRKGGAPATEEVGEPAVDSVRDGDAERMDDSAALRRTGSDWPGEQQRGTGSPGPRHPERLEHADAHRCEPGRQASATAGHGMPALADGGPWSHFRIIPCGDGKARRISAQSGDEPLAAGIPKDLGRPRAVLEGMGFGPKDVKRMLRRPRSVLALASRNRVGRLRGYGNALCVETAAMFIRAFIEATKGRP